MYPDYYSQDFDTLIANTETIITNQNAAISIYSDILLYLQVFVFIFILFFLYIFVRNMIKGR